MTGDDLMRRLQQMPAMDRLAEVTLTVTDVALGMTLSITGVVPPEFEDDTIELEWMCA